MLSETNMELLRVWLQYNEIEEVELHGAMNFLEFVEAISNKDTRN